MLSGPKGLNVGEMIQPPKLAERGINYFVGEPVEYGSIYGYPKYRLPVYAVNPDTGMLGQCVGWIKQEPMADEEGNLAGFTYYTKEGWRTEGQLRFYPSPQALLTAYGMAVFAGTVIDPHADKQAPVDDAPGTFPVADDGETMVVATIVGLEDQEPDMSAEADHDPKNND